MLMKDKIKKHKYFQAIHMKNDNLLDPMTFTLTRATSVAYIEYLMKKHINFALAIIDVDNFKRVNDSYGHQGGDEILIAFSENIMKVMPDEAILGRFGGDEFLLVLEGKSKFEDIYKIMDVIYRSGIRIPIQLSTGKTVGTTATAGISCYPKDSKNYDELFNLCDKCLYLGKQRGRNCFTIYVDYLHKKINIQNTKKNISDRIMQLYETLDSFDKKTKLYHAMEYLTNDISMSGIVYFNKNKVRLSYEKNEEYGIPSILPDEVLERLEKEQYVRIDDYMSLIRENPNLFNFCNENNLLSFIVFPVEISDHSHGYCLFYDSDFRRVWQDDDIALFTIFVKTMAAIAHFGNI